MVFSEDNVLRAYCVHERGWASAGSDLDAQPCSSAAWGPVGVVMGLVADSEHRAPTWHRTGSPACGDRQEGGGGKWDQQHQRAMGAGGRVQGRGVRPDSAGQLTTKGNWWLQRAVG